jgi:hypothetical protein
MRSLINEGASALEHFEATFNAVLSSAAICEQALGMPHWLLLSLMWNNPLP